MARTINFNINWYNGTKTGKYAYIVELFMSLLLSMADTLAHQIYFCFYRFCLLHRINFLLLLLLVVCSHARMSYDPKFDMCSECIHILYIEAAFILYARITALNFAEDVERISNIPLFRLLRIDERVRRSEMCTRRYIFCCCRLYARRDHSACLPLAVFLTTVLFIWSLRYIFSIVIFVDGRRYSTRHIFALLAWVWASAWAWDMCVRAATCLCVEQCFGGK